MVFKIVISFVLACFCLPFPAHAAVTHDLADPANWNIRIDGAIAGDNLGNNFVYTLDINGNSKADLIIGVNYADNNSRINSGSIYIIYDSLFPTEGRGNTLDLSDNSSYNIRIDGAAASHALGGAYASVGDIDSDLKKDLFISSSVASYNSRTNSGSTWVIYGSLLDDYTGTGNNLDLANSSNYNIRYDGAQAEGFLGLSTITDVADLNNNGINDIVINSMPADFNSRVNSGSAYLIFDSLLDDYTGTGNNIDLATTSNFSMRIDGASASNYSRLASIEDLNNDGLNDLLITAYRASYNARIDSGSFYLVYNSIFGSTSGTGNILDLATSTNYSLRYDGATSDDLFGGYTAFPKAIDLDGNSKKDLLLGADRADNNSRANSGSAYVILDSLIDDYTGTGNNIDLATTTNFSLRIDGAGTDHFFSRFLSSSDLDNNGNLDFIGSSFGADSNRGNVYVVHDSILRANFTPGSILDLVNSSSYTMRYISAAEGNRLVGPATNPADFNSDGKNDLTLSSYQADFNSRTDSGSVYIIYNFPHTITLDSVPGNTNATETTLTGRVTAPNSVTDISSVLWSRENNPTGMWTNCAATNGGFDSKDEAFTCNVSAGSDGGQATYIKACDENQSCTAVSRYAQVGQTVDTSGPQTRYTNSQGQERKFEALSPANRANLTDHKPEFKFTKAADNGSGIEKYQVMVYRQNNGNWEWFTYIDDISHDQPNNTIIDNERIWAKYTGDEITVTSKQEELPNGAYQWTVKALDKAGNPAYTDTRILMLNTTQAIFNQNTFFPLTIQQLGGKKLIPNKPLTFWTTPSTKRPFTIWGITPSDTQVTGTFTLVSDTSKQYTLSTTAQNSLYGLNFTTLPKGNYSLKLSATDQSNNYVDMPNVGVIIK